MKMSIRLKSQKGLTIIEVLIASVTFMIGFSIMVFLLGQIIGEYSSKEKVIANNLAQMYMEQTLASDEFEDLIAIEKVSNISFEIRRRISKENNLVKISIDVLRKKTDTKLANIHTERYVR